MKKLIILPFVLLTSTAFAAPTAVEVATAILQDSGLGDAKNLSVIEYTVHSNGTDQRSEHSLKFSHNSRVYECDTFKLTTTPTSPGEYFAHAEIANCESAIGKKLILKNDYTNSAGRTYFRRIFFSDNKKFRFLNDDDEKIVKSRDRSIFRDISSQDESVRVIHTNDLGDGIVIIDSAGAVFPVN